MRSLPISWRRGRGSIGLRTTVRAAPPSSVALESGDCTAILTSAFVADRLQPNLHTQRLFRPPALRYIFCTRFRVSLRSPESSG